MRRFALCLTTLLALSPLAAAGGLRPEWIPEGTQWVAHLDVEAFRRTELRAGLEGFVAEHEEDFTTTFAFSDLVEDAELPAETRAKLARLDFDLWRDLRSVTAIGRGGELEDDLVLLETSGLVHDLLDALHGTPGYDRIRREDLPLHRFSDPDGGEEAGFCYLARVGDDGDRWVTLVSKDAAAIVRSVRVLQREEPALRNDLAGHLRLDPLPSSWLYFEAVGGLPGIEDIDEASMVTRFAQDARLEVGERDGYLEARLVVDTEDSLQATQAAQLLQGLAAFAGLASDEPEMEAVGRLVSGLQFRTDGPRFLVDFEFESRELLRILRELEDS